MGSTASPGARSVRLRSHAIVTAPFAWAVRVYQEDFQSCQAAPVEALDRMKISAKEGAMAEIDGWLHELTRSFVVRSPAETPPPGKLHAAKDFPGLVRAIQSDFGLEKLSIRIRLVNEGGNPQSPAWISMPSPMPPFGSDDFWRVTPALYIRKEFLERMPLRTPTSKWGRPDYQSHARLSQHR
jgi:hypothetical protein